MFQQVLARLVQNENQSGLEEVQSDSLFHHFWVIIIFAYSRKLFMGTFCGIVSLEMETVANDWLASVGNWKWQKNPYSLLSFLGHARSNYRLDSWTSPLCWQQWEEWSKACNSGHATRSPNALVTCSQYNLWSPYFISYR